MMINPVSFSPISFRGADCDNEAVEEEQPQEQQKKKVTAEDIQAGVDDFQKKTKAVGDGIDEVTNTVTETTAKVTGSAVLLGQAFKKLIPKPVYNYFATDVKDEAGKVISTSLNRMTIKGKAIPKLAVWGAGAAVVTTAAILIKNAVKSHKQKEALKMKMMQQELALRSGGGGTN